MSALLPAESRQGDGGCGATCGAICGATKERQSRRPAAADAASPASLAGFAGLAGCAQTVQELSDAQSASRSAVAGLVLAAASALASQTKPMTSTQVQVTAEPHIAVWREVVRCLSRAACGEDGDRRSHCSFDETTVAPPHERRQSTHEHVVARTSIRVRARHSASPRVFEFFRSRDSWRPDVRWATQLQTMLPEGAAGYDSVVAVLNSLPQPRLTARYHSKWRRAEAPCAGAPEDCKTASRHADCSASPDVSSECADAVPMNLVGTRIGLPQFQRDAGDDVATAAPSDACDASDRWMQTDGSFASLLTYQSSLAAFSDMGPPHTAGSSVLDARSVDQFSFSRAATAPSSSSLARSNLSTRDGLHPAAHPPVGATNVGAEEVLQDAREQTDPECERSVPSIATPHLGLPRKLSSNLLAGSKAVTMKTISSLYGARTSRPWDGRLATPRTPRTPCMPPVPRSSRSSFRRRTRPLQESERTPHAPFTASAIAHFCPEGAIVDHPSADGSAASLSQPHVPVKLPPLDASSGSPGKAAATTRVSTAPALGVSVCPFSRARISEAVVLRCGHRFDLSQLDVARACSKRTFALDLTASTDPGFIVCPLCGDAGVRAAQSPPGDQPPDGQVTITITSDDKHAAVGKVRDLDWQHGLALPSNVVGL